MNPESPPPPPANWLEKLSAVIFCIFCFEVGLFLLVYPWLDRLWSGNWFIARFPALRPLLLDEHFRGGLSGLGVLNIFIAIVETFRLRRFSRR